MAMGYKRIETRSWSTEYRGEVAIHASAGTGSCRITHEVEALFKRAGMELPSGWPMTAAEYPLGKIVAVGRLIDVSEMTVDIINRVSDREKAFGEWSPGRFAWVVTSVRRVDPIPWKGSLGLWKVSKELEAKLAA
jgi:hypothetical protein